jgi:hypothetical protein
MCEFASFILTKSNEYYLENSNSHEDIIDKYHFNDNNIVRIEMLPPVPILNEERYTEKFLNKLRDPNNWRFKVDQDTYPDWTYKGDPTLKEKALKVLTRRIKKQKIGYKIEKAYDEFVKVGYGGIAISYNPSIVIAGDYGQAVGGVDSVVIAGSYGQALAGKEGKAIVGMGGVAAAGRLGQIQIDSWYEGRIHTIIGYVGQNGILANTFYKVKDKQLVLD